MSVAARIVTTSIITGTHKTDKMKKTCSTARVVILYRTPFSPKLKVSCNNIWEMACWPLIMLPIARGWPLPSVLHLLPLFKVGLPLRHAIASCKLLNEAPSVVRTALPALVPFKSSPPITTYTIDIPLTASPPFIRRMSRAGGFGLVSPSSRSAAQGSRISYFAT